MKWINSLPVYSIRYKCRQTRFFSLFHFRRRNRNSCALSCFTSLFRNKYSPDTLPYIFSYSHDKLASLRLRTSPEAADPSQPFYADIFPCIHHPRGLSIIPTTLLLSSSSTSLFCRSSLSLSSQLPTEKERKSFHVHVRTDFFSHLRGTNFHRAMKIDFRRK